MSDSLTTNTNSGSEHKNSKPEFYSLIDTNIFSDLKTLLTKPRSFFEFFSKSEHINQVVWAKLILVFLGLAALNTMIAPIMGADWSTSIEGLDSKAALEINKFIQKFTIVSSQFFSFITPIFSLLHLAISAAFSTVIFRFLGADRSTLKWSGLFSVMLSAQWLNVFGFIPSMGLWVTTALTTIYTVIGISQVTRLSKLRVVFGLYILPALIMAIVAGVIVAIVVAAGLAIFS